MPPKPVVAIAGATGSLGKCITKAFLQPDILSKFAGIILLSRQASSPQLDEWKQQGAEIRVYEEDNLETALHGVDVLVNAIGSAGHAFKKSLLAAIPSSNVSLYFPSEFGVDHTIHDFPNDEWNYKKAHYSQAKQMIPNVKVCRLFIGLFMEHSIGPWFGLDSTTTPPKYEAVGASSTKISFTAVDDIGHVVAALAAMDPQSIPDDVRISGDARSFDDIASVMGKAGAGDVQVSVIDYDEYKTKTIEAGTPNPGKYLRFLMGDGGIDHSKEGLGNQNELVNPEESAWKWRKLEDYARETKGKPWADWKPKS